MDIELSEDGMRVLLRLPTHRYCSASDECVRLGYMVDSDGELTTLGSEVASRLKSYFLAGVILDDLDRARAKRLEIYGH